MNQESNSSLVIRTASESETDLLGAVLAAAVEPGLVIGLTGQLGAGKTRLVRATATALGADPNSVNSPTFVLIQEYLGRLPVYHFDTYRLSDPTLFGELGSDEYFSGDGVCFVEWANRVTEFLPCDWLRIDVLAVSETAREFRFSTTGDVSHRVLDRLRQSVTEL